MKLSAKALKKAIDSLPDVRNIMIRHGHEIRVPYLYADPMIKNPKNKVEYDHFVFKKDEERMEWFLINFTGEI